MFEYTSGRWMQAIPYSHDSSIAWLIYNEPLRKSERYLKFDIPALYRTIISSISAKDITSLVKIAEGGFNRIFQATCTDGTQVLARLPYPSTVPRHYTVASEVATLEYLRLKQIPVPRVYGWSSTASNPVGAEYIIMEKLHGKTLGDVWFTLDFKQRYKVIEQIVQLEQKLFSFQLPASGSIYFPNDLDEHELSKSVPLHVQGREFCIGPMAHYSWWHGERSSLECDRGPWRKSNGPFLAVGERELRWTKNFAKPRLHYERLYREVHKFKKMDPQSHVDALNKYLELAKCLGYPPESHLSRPVLRHPDLQPNNIILSETLEIVGLIDWQHATIVPSCLAAGIPKHFQNYGDPESECMAQPARDLPPNFDELSPEEQASVKSQLVRRQTHFLYAALTLQYNEEHYDAIFNNGVIVHQRLYKHAGTPWEGDSITLEAELINANQHWQEIVSSGAIACETPPIRYSDESITSIMDVHRQQEEMDAVMDQMRETLGVDVYGWVPNEEFAATRELARHIKERMIDAADAAEKDGVRNHFPFDDFAEDD
ncbi:kinase-like protein [Byssothecium circinans]|uniref:Kinase-like protein n=1 Tax=Byssothecium circinans TaxID=147558 RepID=A0A6A5UDG4_9PLEO|nr:kinase-like protein [Byssothecium circinans]